MFNIGKVISSFTNVQSGMINDILRRAIPSITQAIDTRGLLDGLSKALGGTSGLPSGAAQQIAQAIAGGAGRSGLGPGVNLEGLPGALTKAMYISILLEAVEDARGKQHFNVETSINDLWVKLAKVRPKQNQELDQTLKVVSQMLKAKGDMTKAIIQNMR